MTCSQCEYTHVTSTCIKKLHDKHPRSTTVPSSVSVFPKGKPLCLAPFIQCKVARENKRCPGELEFQIHDKPFCMEHTHVKNDSSCI